MAFDSLLLFNILLNQRKQVIAQNIENAQDVTEFSPYILGHYMTPGLSYTHQFKTE